MFHYFKGSRLARVSDGSYCIVRDLGLVKGGKGLRHYENLLPLSAKGIASKLGELLRHVAGRCRDSWAGAAIGGLNLAEMSRQPASSRSSRIESKRPAA